MPMINLPDRPKNIPRSRMLFDTAKSRLINTKKVERQIPQGGRTVEWFIGQSQVAYGVFAGSTEEVVVKEFSGFPETKFTDAEARLLRRQGKPMEAERVTPITKP